MSSVLTLFVSIVLRLLLLITAHSGESVEPVLWTLAGLGRHPLLFDVKKMVVYQGMSQLLAR